MAQAIIQQQPVDGDFDDAVDPESDISGDDSGMETDVDDTVHVGGNGLQAQFQTHLKRTIKDMFFI
jgi:hypothetical protein